MVTVRTVTTVLLVDGDQIERQRWVKKINVLCPHYVVLQAQTGKEGISICRTQQVDCVVSELTLPDMSGLQLLAKLVSRAYKPDFAVVILSNIDLPSANRMVKNNGAQAYLIKSQITSDDFIHTIRKAIAKVSPLKEGEWT